ncbi:Aldo/keto reductase family-domain-containing protein [Elsinoe ampelina]|uniref:Aldo/keto reductase family-domain-containing protein n=1 Tax=Elsinoe ampelina TaxID=302913 RepID=A0A6A6GL64_9PEZI|nr:Aldo/keto reductase family-domain-containing protein [Elsinoe ampelina]
MSQIPGKPSAPLSSTLPPLIFGTATFNHQYNKDPYALDTVGLVQEALELGVRAFDTSPYYGPSEQLLGAALDTDFVHNNVPRSDIFILTKCGRVTSDEFDYSRDWVHYSVNRSLERLRTSYLDVVYCHDVEFVTGDEVMEAVTELRRIRDEEGTVKYIGISGYPIDVLCSLAKRVLVETGEPLDVVMSYANFTLQNQTLATSGIQRLKDAGVDVVPNASVLGMGLLRREGVPVGSMGDWHPSSSALREAIRRASDFCDRHDEKLEVIAIRYALESWLTAAESVGSLGDPASGIPWTTETNKQVGGRKLGVSVMGVSNKKELEKTLQVWRSILDGLENGKEIARLAGRWERDHEWSLNRKHAIQIMADGIQEHLAEYLDYAWPSPDPGYVNRKVKATRPEVDVVADSALLTPAASPPPEDLAAPNSDIPVR